MFETSLFWALLIITAAAFYITPQAQVKTRATMLTLASVLALVFVVKVNPLWVVFLIGTSIWLIIGLKVTRRMAANRASLASWLVFLPVLVPWMLGKQAVAVAVRCGKEKVRLIYKISELRSAAAIAGCSTVLSRFLFVPETVRL